jgi:PepSY-associated TM region
VQLFRKLVILSHRYLGMVISLLVVVWFASGILMIYSGGMPVIEPQERLEHLSPLEISKIRISPAQASTAAGFDPTLGFDDRVRLFTVMDRPAYRFGASPTVFADTGETMKELSPEQSKSVANSYLRLPEGKLRPMGTITQVDQWTLGMGRQMPLYKFGAEDGLGTELYVQPKTGEVAMLTTRNSRALAWVSTIPHWLYFTSLRANQPLWYQIVVWTSALACVLTVLGLILSVLQFRRLKPFRLTAAIPYAGWMRWHYITGAIFGIFTLTWAFSGLLSMEPFEWTRAEGLEVPQEVFTGGPLDLTQFSAMDATAWDGLLAGRAVKEVELIRIQDEHYYLVRSAPDGLATAQARERLHQPYNVTGRAETGRLLIDAKTLGARSEPFSVDSLISRLRTALPEAPIVEQELLQDYDSYYYSRGRQTPLPVLRVKFGDPAQTWLYIDPEMSRLVAAVHRLNRVERWLYSGLHDLDFSFWYDRRPLWDIVVITLLLGGLASSGIGLFLGIKRMWRAL